LIGAFVTLGRTDVQARALVEPPKAGCYLTMVHTRGGMRLSAATDCA
jgi:hypothetical protein